ncbi:hypothetical protein [Chryseobacterium culicis]|uniref:hypothetical protein n=1 Tax=Chryseobacterium culicis TaxID=680127 RepID=UPI0018746AF9|nr:hypothetical protein [Chryseobacterium culicis]MBE4950111.1 hypothetical protein [Chryseobacterium culicis]
MLGQNSILRSDGIDSVLGGNFWIGVGQGLIVTAFNFLAHKIESDNKIRNRINKYYNDKSVADASVKESFLNDLAEIFPEIYELSAKNFAIANEGNLKQFNESTGEDYVLKDNKIVSDGGNGENVNGITSMKDGRVLISPYRMRTALGFAATWYHEGIHSFHLVTGMFKAWKIRYGAKEALAITEFYAHSMVDRMSGISVKSSLAFSRYYPSAYIQSLSSFLRP